jgi:hypothetical protein
VRNVAKLRMKIVMCKNATLRHLHKAVRIPILFKGIGPVRKRQEAWNVF